MSKNLALGIDLGVDFGALDKQMSQVADRIRDVGKANPVAVEAAPPELGGGDGAGVFERMSRQMKTAFSGAKFTPDFANITAELNRVGGAIVTLARRIDAAMKFPAMDASISRIAGGFFRVAGGSARAFAAVGAGAVQATVKAFQLNHALGILATAGSIAGLAVAGRILGIVGASAAAAGAVVKLGQSIWRITGRLSAVGDVAGKTFTKLFHLGTLGVFKKLSAGAEGSVGVMGRLRGAIHSVGGELLAALGVFGVVYKVVEFFKDGIKGASDLNETVSRSEVVFGTAFGPVKAQAESMSKAFGLTRNAQLGIASGFGAMAQGAGYSEAESANLANTMTKLAGDLSSSVNISFEDAGDKIRSALAGQSEPLRQFGVMLTEDSVKAYALSHGLGGASGALSEHAKMAARAALVAQGLAYAQGDLERTAGSTANQFRKAGGGMAEFATRIGELLLPAVNLGVEAFNELLAVVLDVFEASLPTIQTWAGYLMTAVNAVGVVVRNFGAIWRIATLEVGAFVTNAVLWIETLPTNFGLITKWIGENWWNLWVDLVNGTEIFLTNLLDNATRFGQAIWKALKGEGFEFDWKPLMKGFQAQTEALPDMLKPKLVDVSAEVSKIMGEITDRETARLLNVPKAVGVKKPGAAAEAAKIPEYKLAGAVEVGSKEAYSAIARNQTGYQSTTNAVREGNKIAKDAHATLTVIAKNTGGGGAKPALVVK